MVSQLVDWTICIMDDLRISQVADSEFVIVTF